jgi:hypothetical protein
MVIVLQEESPMLTFTWVSGRLIEVHRFINVPMRWCEQYSARERRELWISTGERSDFKLIVHTRTMPARCGHAVVCVLHEGHLTGLRNLTTGGWVNFVRSDPPLLWRRCDSLTVVLLLVFALAICPAWPLLGIVAALCGLLHGSAKLCVRWRRRRWLLRATERAMELATHQATVSLRLWRVK